jgi:tripartite-type tricarboxylate transporter receptor subunit TctC
MKRQTLKMLAALSLAAVGGATRAQTETFPRRPILWVVPYAPGGTTDLMARRLGPSLGRNLGQEVVVENRPGAASIVGASFVSRATPDGYTVGTVDSGTLAFNPAMYSSLSYDAVNGFSLIGALGRMPLVLVVNPAFPAANLDAFLAEVRKAPDGVSGASSGPGSPLHVALEMLKMRTRTRIRHVAYKGSAPALQDVIDGQAQSMFIDLPPSLAAIRTGKVRVLAVATRQRLPILPGVPTLWESGVSGFEAYAWQGLAGPAGLPDAVVRKLNRELVAAIRLPENRAELEARGIEPMPMSPAEFTAFVRGEQKFWADIIKKARISLD